MNVIDQQMDERYFPIDYYALELVHNRLHKRLGDIGILLEQVGGENRQQQEGCDCQEKVKSKLSKQKICRDSIMGFNCFHLYLHPGPFFRFPTPYH